MKNKIYIYLISILTTYLLFPLNVLSKENEGKLDFLIASWNTNKAVDVLEGILCELGKAYSNAPMSNVSEYGIRILNLEEPDINKGEFYRNNFRIFDALLPFIRKNPENYCELINYFFDYYKKLNEQIIPQEKIKRPKLYNSGFPKKIFTQEEELEREKIFDESNKQYWLRRLSRRIDWRLDKFVRIAFDSCEEFKGNLPKYIAIMSNYKSTDTLEELKKLISENDK